MRDALHRIVAGKKILLPISTDTFIWALQCACQLHRVPFAAEMALRQFLPPYNSATLQHAVHELGFKGRWRKVQEADLEHLVFPCFAALNPPPAQTPSSGEPVTETEGKQISSPQPEPHGLALLVKIEEGKVLFFGPASQEPQYLPLTEFSARCAGHVLQFSAPKNKGVDGADANGLAGRQKEFGFRWFVPELLKHKKMWRDVLLASLAIQLMGLATPLFTQVMIDKVIVHHAVSTLRVIAFGMLIFLVFNALMSWVRQYLVTHTGNRIDSVLGSQVFAHLFKLPLRYFEHRSTGTLVARLQGIESIREFLSGAAVTLILDVPFLVIFLAIMFYYSWVLTVAALTLLLLIVLLSVFITPMLRKRLNHQFMLGARNQAFVTEYISGMETVKSLQMEPRVVTRYGEYLASYLEAGFNSRQLSNSYNVAANTLEQLMTLVILCLGAWLVMTTHDRDTGDFTIGMLVAFQMFAGRLSQPVLRMVGLWQEFQQASIAVKRLGDVMHAPAEPYSLLPAREGGGHGKVEIRNLSFRYADNLPYLYQNFNMSIVPGQCIALMGPSGSGKSTLAKLMQGFYLPNEGGVHIDDRDIRHFSANELRQHFGVVPQETILFSGTLYENLILASPHATFDQVVQACKLAEIHEAIEKLPEGYQTPIGERGVGLSGGQKQRVAIARALLKHPKILIFDEAISSLDSATAEHFASTVNQLKGKVTILFITHQLPSTLKVDEVVKLGTSVRTAT